MDTWMTSSLTPQVNDGWAVGGTDPALAPMSMRVQAFELIRTWLFYSVVQSELLFGRVPWRTALISGWGLNEQGRKLSKRDLGKSDGYNRYVPDDVMDKYGADALRLWASKGRMSFHDPEGSGTSCGTKVFAIKKRTPPRRPQRGRQRGAGQPNGQDWHNDQGANDRAGRALLDTRTRGAAGHRPAGRVGSAGG